MTLRLDVIGVPRLVHDGGSHTLAFERRSQLLVHLALKRTWVRRSDLAALLWPEQAPSLALTNLRKTLFRLPSFPGAPDVEIQGGALRFDASVDLFDFETALRESRLGDALALRRGELLEGFDDDGNEAWTSWLGFERERVRAAWRGAALERLGGDVSAQEAISLSSALLASDPLDESALGAQLQALARNGQVGLARQAYRAFATRLAGELGIEPGTGLKRLHDRLGTTATVATQASSPPSKPPVATVDDGFVGRAGELRRIGELLVRDGCRLLSLVGPGGAGKTRLARRALAELAPAYEGGGRFVALDDVDTEVRLCARIAQALELPPDKRNETLAPAIDSLRDRQVVLVLDNFEQLVPFAAVVERLLAACPGVRIVVTSRIRLALADEQLLPLAGLPCPDAEDADIAESFDAVRLFVQAAHRVEPSLVAARESAAIADICRRVEGLPLAIELAAAWTRVLPCEAIAAELHRESELLRTRDPTRPARHASLELVFEQSWSLLGASERDALARLSVFRGGFTAEAARAVAGASLPLLGALADKSLVRRDGSRLVLHALVGQMAALRLDASGARADTERAHAAYFHRLLAQLRDGVDDGDAEALRQIDVEAENGRAAWRWAVGHGRSDWLKSSLPTVLHYCDHRFRLEAGLALLRDALAALPPAPERIDDRVVVARLLAASAHLEYRLDRYAAATATATRALDASAFAGADRESRLLGLNVLGGCSLRVGRIADARQHYEAALRLAPPGVDPRLAAGLTDNLALVAKAAGDYDESMRLSLESLSQLRRLGDSAGTALCLNNLGALQADRGEFEAAMVWLNEGRALAEKHGLTSTQLYLLANIAEVAMKTGDVATTKSVGARALALTDDLGNRGTEGWLHLILARSAARDGDVETAMAHLVDALRSAIGIALVPLQLDAVACFAEVLRARGEAAAARRVLAFAAGHDTTRAPDRDAMRERLATWEAADRPGSDGAGVDIGLDELTWRIVAEREIGHAQLLARLNA